MLISSLKFTKELFLKPPTWIPQHPTLNNYSTILENPLFLRYLIYTIPLSSWLLKGFFQEIPEEIIDSARVDGCSHLLTFFKIALPLVRPGVAATAIYCFIMAWQEFFFALSFMFDDEMKTLTVGILGFMGQYIVF